MQGRNFSSRAVYNVTNCVIRQNLVVNNSNTLYVVMTSGDISYPGFCTRFCGWHYATSFNPPGSL